MNFNGTTRERARFALAVFELRLFPPPSTWIARQIWKLTSVPAVTNRGCARL